MKASIAIAAAFLFLAVEPATARDYQLSSTDREMAWFVDTGSLARSGNQVQGWEVRVFHKNSEYYTRGWRYQSVQTEYDCSKRFVRVVASIIYGDDGRPLATRNYGTGWMPTAPGTPIETNIQIACDGKSSGPPFSAENPMELAAYIRRLEESINRGDGPKTR